MNITSTTPEIEELKALVEKKYGFMLRTTTDFDAFTVHLKNECSEIVSSSTLKRLWGYVNDEHKPSTTTLNKLAKYVGHPNYPKFCEWLKTTPQYSSSFFHTEQIASNELKPGDRLRIGWKPNRVVTLSYLGNNTYEVTSSENSKLRTGDRMSCAVFQKGYPLYLPPLIRNGKETDSYVAGRDGGLSVLEKI